MASQTCCEPWLLLVLDHLGVDHVAAAGAAAAARRSGAAGLLTTGRVATRRLRLAVKLFCDLVLRLGQLLDALLDSVLVARLERGLERRHRRFDRRLVVRRQLVAGVG